MKDNAARRDNSAISSDYFVMGNIRGESSMLKKF